MSCNHAQHILISPLPRSLTVTFWGHTSTCTTETPATAASQLQRKHQGFKLVPSCPCVCRDPHPPDFPCYCRVTYIDCWNISSVPAQRAKRACWSRKGFLSAAMHTAGSKQNQSKPEYQTQQHLKLMLLDPFISISWKKNIKVGASSDFILWAPSSPQILGTPSCSQCGLKCPHEGRLVV